MSAFDDVGVNREKTCPLLLRMFCSTMKHNNVLEYSKGKTPLNELQVYTWLDATLRELASLIKQVNPEARKRGTLFDFALVFPDQRSTSYKMRELGTVCSGSPSDTDRIMLKDCHFVIGDMIDVAITIPLGDDNLMYATEMNMPDLLSRTIKRSPNFNRSRSRPNDSSHLDYRNSNSSHKSETRPNFYGRESGTSDRKIYAKSSSDRRHHDTTNDRPSGTGSSRRVVPY